MPKRPSLLPKYCLHKPSGQSYVRIHGKVVYCGKYGSPESQQEYGRLIAELAAGHVSTPPAAPSPQLTVVELCAAYLDYARSYYRMDGKPTRTIQGILAAIRTLKSLYAQTLVEDFGPLSLLAIQTKLAGDELSRNYVNKQTAYIRRIFKWGVSRQLVSPSVHTGLTAVEGLRMGRSIAKESTPILPVPDADVDAVTPFLPEVVADMVRIQRLTGARPGEVCQMRPADIDRSGEVWTYRPQHHKNAFRGKSRTIFIGPQAQTILLPYLLREATSYCFAPEDSVKKQNIEKRARRRTHVQPSQACRKKRHPKSQPGQAYGRQSYCQAIARAIQKANEKRREEAAKHGQEPVIIKRWKPNQLRHRRASEVRQQFGLEAAQVTLGHARADITEVYAERDARLAIEVAKKTG